jgi:hypothetical protein
VPYADPRAYTDRLNALFSPQGLDAKVREEIFSLIEKAQAGDLPSQVLLWLGVEQDVRNRPRRTCGRSC